MIKTSKIGPVTISVTSEKNHCNEVIKIIAKELNLVDSLDNQNIDIELKFVNRITSDIYTADRFSAKGNLNFNENSWFVGYNKRFDYVITNLFITNEPIQIQISLKKNTRQQISSFVRSLLVPHSNLNIDAAKAIMSYSLFWYAFNIALLKKDSVFLHAGIFINNNSKAIALTGTGGGGKTSTLFNILNDGCQYLSEDFGIISRDKKTYFNPKAISLYHSDILTGQKLFNEYAKKSIKGTKKLRWLYSTKILGLNPMLKVPVDEMVSITQKNNGHELDSVIYLVRTREDKFDLVNICAEEMTERVFYSSYREMKTISELLMLIRANSDLKCYPSEDELRSRMRDIYHDIFQKTNNKILYIPHKSSPQQVKDYLLQQGVLELK